MISVTGPLYTLDGVAPRVHESAFIAPTAAVIGDVEIGPAPASGSIACCAATPT